MRNSLILSMPFVLILISLMIPMNGEADSGMDPLIEEDLILDIRSPIDSDPLMLSLVIPWSDGPPVIENVTYSRSDGNWSELEGWERMCLEGDNQTIIDFSMHFDWGRSMVILLRITDDMGTNSTVGKEIICSRPPVVDIIPEDPVRDRYPGIHRFSAGISDPDGQEMVLRWTVDGAPASSEDLLTAHLDAGAHRIELNVSDGQWWVEDVIDILVVDQDTEETKEGKDIIWYLSLAFLGMVILFTLAFSVYVVNERLKRSQLRRMIQNGERKVRTGSSRSACDICLGGLEKGSKTMSCRCGARFHTGCGRREGTCPECGREILI